MPDDIKVNPELGLIEIRSYGNESQEDLEAIINKVLHINTKTSIDRVLVDTTQLQSLPSTVNIFSTMSSLPLKIKVALIATKNQPTANDIRFGETVARNRGIRFQTFSAISDAIEWLSK